MSENSTKKRLLLILEQLFKTTDEDNDIDNTAISISELENGKNSLKNLFHFNRVIINEYLDQLATQGKIRLEKTAGLDMVYLTSDDTEKAIVENYYKGSVNLWYLTNM